MESKGGKFLELFAMLRNRSKVVIKAFNVYPMMYLSNNLREGLHKRSIRIREEMVQLKHRFAQKFRKGKLGIVD